MPQPKPRLDSVMNALAEQYPESTTLRLMREKPDRPLGDFINTNTKSQIWLVIDERPTSGLVELIEEDIYSDMVYRIETDYLSNKPEGLIDKIAEITPAMKREVKDPSKTMVNHINRLGEDVFSILQVPSKIITEEEYGENFHQFFAGREVDEDVRKNIVNTWMKITKSASEPVIIVDAEGYSLFRHPGMMGLFDMLGNYASWTEFTRKGKEQAEILPGMKEAYQKDVINGFTETLEATKFDYNLGAIIELERIKQYFDDKVGYVDPERLDLEKMYGVVERPKAEEVIGDAPIDDMATTPAPPPAAKKVDWGDVYE